MQIKVVITLRAIVDFADRFDPLSTLVAAPASVVREGVDLPDRRKNRFSGRGWKPNCRCRPAVDKGASSGYVAIMKTVGLKDLKNKLSEYVRLAQAGETVVVTDRGLAVAQIVPFRSEPDSIIERGIREGWIRPAKRGPNWPPKPKPIPGLTLEQLMAELDRDREDRR